MTFLKELIISIEKSLESKNWHAALAVALILPDICGKIDTPDKHSRRRYEIWFDKYVKKFYMIQESIGSAMISGGDCYAIRCALLHEFSDDLTEHKARNILNQYKFYSPDSGMNVHRIKEQGNGFLLEIRVDEFCNTICYGVSGWLNELHASGKDISTLVKIYE